MSNLTKNIRYKVLHNIPFIDSLKKGDIIEDEYVRVPQGLIKMSDFPDTFKRLEWYEDIDTSKLPKKQLKAIKDRTNTTIHNHELSIQSDEVYVIYDYKIGYSGEKGAFAYSVKVHLPNGIGTFPLSCFEPIEDGEK